MEIALSLERVAQNIQDLNTKKEGSSHTQKEVHGVSSTGSPVGGTRLTCYRCGNKGHTVAKCRVSKDVVCHKCGKPGHLQRACRGGTQQSRIGKYNKTWTVSQDREGAESGPEDETLCHVRSKNSTSSPPIKVEVKVDDCLITMEVDAGASMSLMAVSTFKSLWPRKSLQQSDVQLRTYSKNSIPVVGSCGVMVEYNGQTAFQMPLVIVEEIGDKSTTFTHSKPRSMLTLMQSPVSTVLVQFPMRYGTRWNGQHLLCLSLNMTRSTSASVETFV